MHSTNPKIRLWKKKERKNRESGEKRGGQVSTLLLSYTGSILGTFLNEKNTAKKTGSFGLSHLSTENQARLRIIGR